MNAGFCPTDSRSPSSSILERSRTVFCAQRLKAKQAELISRMRDSILSALDAELECTGRNKQSVPADGVFPDRIGDW